MWVSSQRLTVDPPLYSMFENIIKSNWKAERSRAGQRDAKFCSVSAGCEQVLCRWWREGTGRLNSGILYYKVAGGNSHQGLS